MSQDVLRRARGFERGNRRRARQDPNRTRRRLAGERVEVALVVAYSRRVIGRRGFGGRGRRGRRRNGRCGAGPVQRLGTTGAGQVPLATPRWGGGDLESGTLLACIAVNIPPTSRSISPDARGAPVALTARRSSLSIHRTSRVGARSVPKGSSARRGISTPACATSRHRFCPVGGLRALEARLAGFAATLASEHRRRSTLVILARVRSS